MKDRERVSPQRDRQALTTVSDLAVTPPMEAKLVDELPSGSEWQYEPKWDGFRAIASRSGNEIMLMSKSGKSLARYFPEIVEALTQTSVTTFVIDGELILPQDDVLSFDALQARLHPAPSRIQKLSRETPAQLMLFDCLLIGDKRLIDTALSERRPALEDFLAKEDNESLLLSPATTQLAQAQQWLAHSGGALDGVIAKDRTGPYMPGERRMLKVKQRRSADCVVGGFRRSKDQTGVASLLLGLYDDAGLLHHVGFTSAFSGEDKAVLLARLQRYAGGSGFTGKAPGGPSRWNNGAETPWTPLAPELVVEVGYDQVTGNRFRHATSLLRWRPDKRPSQCTMEQLLHKLRPSDLNEIG